jgi:glycosyltransferase involved in cell wall biosynthesis
MAPVNGGFRVALMALNAAGSSGVPRYIRALARGLDAVAHQYSELTLVLVTTPQGAEMIGSRSMQTAVRGLGAGRMRSSFRLGLEQIVLSRLRVDLIHFFDVNGAFLPPRRPFTATFHDAAIRYPSMAHFTRSQHAYKNRLYPWSLARARRVVAVSDFAREEAIRHFQVDPRMVITVRSGPGMVAGDDAGPARSEAVAIRRDAPYFLFVGNLTTSKNLPFLVRAFSRADLGVDLVLAGHPAGGSEDVQTAIRSSPIKGRIHVVLGPDDAALDRLYRDALGLVLPSRYEGFGFPPLEAMARGCPVLASDIQAVREVSGPGALLLPLEEEAWAEGMKRVAFDPSLRADLRRRGQEWVRRYSWQETGRGLCRVLLAAAKDACEQCGS